MTKEELDVFLHENTEREQFYLEHPGSLSPTYRTMEYDMINNKKVYLFKLQDLPAENILIRKDSRYTGVPYHRHTNINMNYIYAGSCTYDLNNNKVTLQAGDVCIFDRDVIRAKDVLSENDIVFNISMSNTYFSGSLRNHLVEQSIVTSFLINALSQNTSHDQYLIFRTMRSPNIIQLFTALLLEYYSQTIYFKEIIQSYIDIIVMELLRLHTTTVQAEPAIQFCRPSDTRLLDILQYIEIHYRDCTIQKLAENFHYHPKYLSAFIHRKTGKTFKELQLQQRMNMTCQMLKSTSVSIQEIIDTVGFSNQSFFYNKFSELYGMTPFEYRKHTKTIL